MSPNTKKAMEINITFCFYSRNNFSPQYTFAHSPRQKRHKKLARNTGALPNFTKKKRLENFYIAGRDLQPRQNCFSARELPRSLCDSRQCKSSKKHKEQVTTLRLCRKYLTPFLSPVNARTPTLRGSCGKLKTENQQPAPLKVTPSWVTAAVVQTAGVADDGVIVIANVPAPFVPQL